MLSVIVVINIQDSLYHEGNSAWVDTANYYYISHHELATIGTTARSFLLLLLLRM